MVTTPIHAQRAASRGAFAGVTAGIALTLMMTMMSAAAGKDVWYGIKGAAVPFLGERAMDPGFDLLAVVLGLVCHLVISAGWGALFGLMFHAANRTTTIVAGVLWGFVVWIGMYYVVLPLVGLSSMQEDAPVGRAIAFHLFFSVIMTAAFVLSPHVYGAGGPRHGRRLDRSAHAH